MVALRQEFAAGVEPDRQWRLRSPPARPGHRWQGRFGNERTDRQINVAVDDELVNVRLTQKSVVL